MVWIIKLSRLLRLFSAVLQRRVYSAFKEGEFVPIFADDTMVAYIRTDGKNTVLTAVNVGVTTVQIEVPKEYGGKGYVVYPNSYILESI